MTRWHSKNTTTDESVNVIQRLVMSSGASGAGRAGDSASAAVRRAGEAAVEGDSRPGRRTSRSATGTCQQDGTQRGQVRSVALH